MIVDAYLVFRHLDPYHLEIYESFAKALRETWKP